MNESIAVAAERQQPPVSHFISIGKAVRNYYNQIGDISDSDDADDEDDQENTYQALKDESHSPSDEEDYAVYTLRPDESDHSQDEYSEQYIRVMPAEISAKKNSAAWRKIFEGVHVPPEERARLKARDKAKLTEAASPRRPATRAQGRPLENPLEATTAPRMVRPLEVIPDPIPFEARKPRIQAVDRGDIDMREPSSHQPEHSAIEVVRNSGMSNTKPRPKAAEEAPPNGCKERLKDGERTDKEISKSPPKPKGRQTGLSSTIDEKDVLEKLLSIPVTLELREVLGSSKEIRTSLNDIIKARNTKTAAMVAEYGNPMIAFATRSRGLLIRMKVEMEGREILAIIDTGSQINVVKEEIVERIIKKPIDLQRGISMNDANGGEGYLKGRVNGVNLVCGGVLTKANLYVGENPPFDLLLGRPWQRGNFVSIDERPKGTYLVFKDPETMTPRYEYLVAPELMIKGDTEIADHSFFTRGYQPRVALYTVDEDQDRSIKKPYDHQKREDSHQEPIRVGEYDGVPAVPKRRKLSLIREVRSLLNETVQLVRVHVVLMSLVAGGLLCWITTKVTLEEPMDKRTRGQNETAPKQSLPNQNQPHHTHHLPISKLDADMPTISENNAAPRTATDLFLDHLQSDRRLPRAGAYGPEGDYDPPFTGDGEHRTVDELIALEANVQRQRFIDGLPPLTMPISISSVQGASLLPDSDGNMPFLCMNSTIEVYDPTTNTRWIGTGHGQFTLQLAPEGLWLNELPCLNTNEVPFGYNHVDRTLGPRLICPPGVPINTDGHPVNGTSQANEDGPQPASHAIHPRIDTNTYPTIAGRYSNPLHLPPSPDPLTNISALETREQVEQLSAEISSSAQAINISLPSPSTHISYRMTGSGLCAFDILAAILDKTHPCDYHRDFIPPVEFPTPHCWCDQHTLSNPPHVPEFDQRRDPGTYPDAFCHLLDGLTSRVILGVLQAFGRPTQKRREHLICRHQIYVHNDGRDDHCHIPRIDWILTKLRKLYGYRAHDGPFASALRLPKTAFLVLKAYHFHGYWHVPYCSAAERLGNSSFESATSRYHPVGLTYPAVTRWLSRHGQGPELGEEFDQMLYQKGRWNALDIRKPSHVRWRRRHADFEYLLTEEVKEESLDESTPEDSSSGSDNDDDDAPATEPLLTQESGTSNSVSINKYASAVSINIDTSQMPGAWIWDQVAAAVTSIDPEHTAAAPSFDMAQLTDISEGFSGSSTIELSTDFITPTTGATESPSSPESTVDDSIPHTPDPFDDEFALRTIPISGCWCGHRSPHYPIPHGLETELHNVFADLVRVIDPDSDTTPPTDHANPAEIPRPLCWCGHHTLGTVPHSPPREHRFVAGTYSEAFCEAFDKIVSRYARAVEDLLGRCTAHRRFVNLKSGRIFVHEIGTEDHCHIPLFDAVLNILQLNWGFRPHYPASVCLLELPRTAAVVDRLSIRWGYISKGHCRDAWERATLEFTKGYVFKCSNKAAPQSPHPNNPRRIINQSDIDLTHPAIDRWMTRSMRARLWPDENTFFYNEIDSDENDTDPDSSSDETYSDLPELISLSDSVPSSDDDEFGSTILVETRAFTQSPSPILVPAALPVPEVPVLTVGGPTPPMLQITASTRPASPSLSLVTATAVYDAEHSATPPLTYSIAELLRLAPPVSPALPPPPPITVMYLGSIEYTNPPPTPVIPVSTPITVGPRPLQCWCGFHDYLTPPHIPDHRMRWSHMTYPPVFSEAFDRRCAAFVYDVSQSMGEGTFQRWETNVRDGKIVRHQMGTQYHIHVPRVDGMIDAITSIWGFAPFSDDSPFQLPRLMQEIEYLMEVWGYDYLPGCSVGWFAGANAFNEEDEAFQRFIVQIPQNRLGNRIDCPFDPVKPDSRDEDDSSPPSTGTSTSSNDELDVPLYDEPMSIPSPKSSPELYYPSPTPSPTVPQLTDKLALPLDPVSPIVLSPFHLPRSPVTRTIKKPLIQDDGCNPLSQVSFKPTSLMVGKATMPSSKPIFVYLARVASQQQDDESEVDESTMDTLSDEDADRDTAAMDTLSDEDAEGDIASSTHTPSPPCNIYETDFHEIRTAPPSPGPTFPEPVSAPRPTVHIPSIEHAFEEGNKLAQELITMDTPEENSVSSTITEHGSVSESEQGEINIVEAMHEADTYRAFLFDRVAPPGLTLSPSFYEAPTNYPPSHSLEPLTPAHVHSLSKWGRRLESLSQISRAYTRGIDSVKREMNYHGLTPVFHNYFTVHASSQPFQSDPGDIPTPYAIPGEVYRNALLQPDDAFYLFAAARVLQEHHANAAADAINATLSLRFLDDQGLRTLLYVGRL